MEFARLQQNGEVFYAVHQNGAYYPIQGDCFDVQGIQADPVVGDYKLLAPVQPSKIVALGANYRKHAAELQMEIKPEPLLFLKPPSALQNPGDPITIANPEHRTDYEAELVIVIGKTCKNATAKTAAEYILGYTCGNDVSDRVLQAQDGQWVRAKGFDSYCPIGPHIVTDLDPNHLSVQTIRNQELVQDGNTNEMITGTDEAVAFISNVMTLYPGDIIMTGTPDGIGPLHGGDVVEILIEGIGRLVNPVLE